MMKDFIREVDGFKTNKVYNTDTDSLYIQKRHWDVLDGAKLVYVKKFMRKFM